MLTKENGFALPVLWKFPEANKYAFIFISLLITLIAVYSNGFQGEWHFDDFYNIVQNPNIQMKSLSVDNIKHSIYGMSLERTSRPLSYFSFALNYYFGGLNVFGYHIVNFFIHYLAAVFLFLFIYNTLKLPLIKERYTNIAYPVALLATFLWALHPIQVTSVTYIVQRMASMTALFYIMSMYLYLKGRTAEKLSLSIIFFIFCFLAGLASVLSKENAVMLPVSILLFDLFLIQGVSKDSVKKSIKIIIVPFIIILFFGLFYTGGFSNALGGYGGRDFTMVQRVLTEPRVILFYLSLLVYPIFSRLTLLYDIDVSRTLLQPWTTIPAILLIILIISGAFYMARKRPLLSFCIIFYFLNHLIEGSIFPLELIFEHRNYLPSMLLFVPIAGFMIYAIDYFSYKKTVQLIVAAGVVLIIAGEGDITYQRNTVVSSEFLLWTDNIEKYPLLSRPYTNLGLFYVEHNQKDKGLYNFEKAMALDNFANSAVRAMQEHNLGIYYFFEGKFDLALSYFTRAYKTIPYYLPTTFYTAKTYLLKNEYSEAHRIIEPLIKKHPGNPELNEIFCLILLKENKLKDAEMYAKKFLKNNLSSTFPLPVLAEIAHEKGNFQSAVILWKLYQNSSPADAYANLALIELYAKTDNQVMMRNELSKLFCFKKTLPLTSYLEYISRNKNLLAYVPDTNKITAIIRVQNICNE
jgi:protein O-mannosyl-transferase